MLVPNFIYLTARLDFGAKGVGGVGSPVYVPSSRGYAQKFVKGGKMTKLSPKNRVAQ